MKKFSLLIIAVCSCLSVTAQDVSDALRYSQDNLKGTARFRGMSGAFGAVGGDLSAININPAGSSIFSSSNAAISLGVDAVDTNSVFGGNRTSASDSDISLNQAGAVFVFNETSGSDWTRAALAINYDQINNFDNEIFATGNNNIGLDSFFLSNANGFALENFETLPGESVDELYQFLGEEPGLGLPAQIGLLAYQAFVINSTDDTDLTNPNYVSNVGAGSFDQEFLLESNGSQSKINLNGSTSYKDRLYLGANLNIHAIDYSESRLFNEFNSNAGGPVEAISYLQQLQAEGSGFSFSLGAIGKVTDFLRVGLSYDSPTWYDIDETLTLSLQSRRLDGSGGTITEDVTPQILNVYPTYQLQTPQKLTASAVVLFGKRGLISVDYGVKDFSSIELGPSRDFSNVNADISQQLSDATTLNVGGEYKVGRYSLRAGYRYEESPYKNSDSFVDDLTGYSLGLGYQFTQQTRLDIAYDHAERDGGFSPFSGGVLNNVRTNTAFDNVTISMSYNF